MTHHIVLPRARDPALDEGAAAARRIESRLVLATAVDHVTNVAMWCDVRSVSVVVCCVGAAFVQYCNQGDFKQRNSLTRHRPK
jgi:hypothetical protein